MGRRRTKNKHLPKGVYSVVNRHGQEYFYYQYARGTKHAGPRVDLGKDPTDPEFWRKLQSAKGAPTAMPAGTWSALLATFGRRNFRGCGLPRNGFTVIASTVLMPPPAIVSSRR